MNNITQPGSADEEPNIRPRIQEQVDRATRVPGIRDLSLDSASDLTDDEINAIRPIRNVMLCCGEKDPTALYNLLMKLPNVTHLGIVSLSKEQIARLPQPYLSAHTGSQNGGRTVIRENGRPTNPDQSLHEGIVYAYGHPYPIIGNLDRF